MWYCIPVDVVGCHKYNSCFGGRHAVQCIQKAAVRQRSHAFIDHRVWNIQTLVSVCWGAKVRPLEKCDDNNNSKQRKSTCDRQRETNWQTLLSTDALLNSTQHKNYKVTNLCKQCQAACIKVMPARRSYKHNQIVAVVNTPKKHHNVFVTSSSKPCRFWQNLVHIVSNKSAIQ